jgi:hypothetical protein
MPNPWDVPKPELIGTPNADQLYIAIGRALSEWEPVEAACARIFAYLVGAPIEWHEVSPAMRAFGTVISFPGRKEMIEAAAKAYFHLHQPLTHYKQYINDALGEANNFASRRNEIAHGVVKEVIDHDTNRSIGYYLVPSFFNPKKFPITMVPTFQYVEKNLIHFRQEFTKLGLKLESILHHLQQDAQQSSAPPTAQNRSPLEDQS